MLNQNQEQIARDNIDKQLIACGWVIQHKKKINLHASIGVAVIGEYQTDVGPVDYLLFVDGKPCGVIEAKKEEVEVFKKELEIILGERERLKKKKSIS